MIAAQQAEHTALRRGAVTGRPAGVVRISVAPADDPWYQAPRPVPPGREAAA